jgi:hypothetical protein
MSALRLLALSYLASASVFVMAATLAAHPDLPRELAAGSGALVEALAEQLRAPADEPVARIAIAPPEQMVARVMPHHQVEANDRLAEPEFSSSAIVTVLPDLSPESAFVPPEPKLVRPAEIKPPEFKIARAPAFRIPEPPPLAGEGASRSDNRMALPGPVKSRGGAAALRLQAKLTPEMVQNFGLILYVSKAKNGPLGQHMVVMENHGGALTPLYDWAVSTGREHDEISPRGRSSFTSTPAGFYEFDPDRMYRRYHSYSWMQDMPHAMFFNWERQGVKTGLAIHSAVGDDIAKLGTRASAGCVHVAPENAALLFELIKRDYRGPAPRFAYSGANQTMSNRGNFLHDSAGRLKMADGYRVLVVIDDYSGEELVAGLD